MNGGFRLPEGLAVRLARVRSVGVITGAGISAESGIPTYRGKGGIYDDPEEGDRTIEALSAPMIHEDPDRCWRAIGQIAKAAGGATPNAAHRALVDIENSVERFVLLTQNVDGLHRIAGTRNIIDIHGDTSHIYCMKCGARDRLMDRSNIDRAPRCKCGGVMRPDVVLFGEMLPPEKVQRLYAEFFDNPPDAVISIGTSSMFAYIIEPVAAAVRAGRLTIEVNTEPTSITDIVDYHLQAPAGKVLPLLAGGLAARRH
ncbi:MAG: NAD-dependent protein deacylase [Planctomycetes bacterium]|nr:NAD-dependent protein deacylase [Planctomycetota bacterium]